MKTYLLIFLLASGSSLVFTPLVRRWCEWVGLLDEIRDGRRVHRKPVPRLGGVAIFASLVVALGTLLLLENLPTQSVRDSWPRLLPVVLPGVLIFLCGVYDDIFSVNARFKFIVQILTGILFYYLGGRIEGLTLPFVGPFMLPPALGFALTVLWIVAVTNAFNLLDGLDGLAAGTALFASMVLLVVSYQIGHVHILVFGLALCGALAGFLRYNFNPASIFLGDSGSLMLGFLLAALSVQGAQKASTAVALTIPVIAFGLPIFDTIFSIIRRFIGGKPLFAGDREHVHHKLLELGWSHRKVVLTLYAVSAVLGMFSLLFVNNSTATGVFLFIIGGVIIITANHLQYNEIAEVRAGLRRNAMERRRRVAYNVQVRRAAQKMAQANNWEEFFAAIEQCVAHQQFAGAKVWLRANPLANPGKVPGLVTKPGGWRWSWTRDKDSDEAFDPAANWQLTVPLCVEEQERGRLEFYRPTQEGPLLLDINLLCKLFQRETARTLARLDLAAQNAKATEKKAIVDVTPVLSSTATP